MVNTEYRIRNMWHVCMSLGIVPSRRAIQQKMQLVYGAKGSSEKVDRFLREYQQTSPTGVISLRAVGDRMQNPAQIRQNPAQNKPKSRVNLENPAQAVSTCARITATETRDTYEMLSYDNIMADTSAHAVDAATNSVESVDNVKQREPESLPQAGSAGEIAEARRVDAPGCRSNSPGAPAPSRTLDEIRRRCAERATAPPIAGIAEQPDYMPKPEPMPMQPIGPMPIDPAAPTLEELAPPITPIRDEMPAQTSLLADEDEPAPQRKTRKAQREPRLPLANEPDPIAVAATTFLRRLWPSVELLLSTKKTTWMHQNRTIVRDMIGARARRFNSIDATVDDLVLQHERMSQERGVPIYSMPHLQRWINATENPEKPRGKPQSQKHLTKQGDILTPEELAFYSRGIYFADKAV